MGRTDWLTAVKDFHFMVMRRFYFSSSRLKWVLGRCTGRSLPALHCQETLTLCPTPHSNVGHVFLFCFAFFFFFLNVFMIVTERFVHVLILSLFYSHWSLKGSDGLREVVNQDFQTVWFILQKRYIFLVKRNCIQTSTTLMMGQFFRLQKELFRTNYVQSLGGMYILRNHQTIPHLLRLFFV